MEKLRPRDERRARSFPPRHRRPHPRTRQHADLGVEPAPGDDLDGRGGGRQTRDGARRLPGRNQRAVVQRHLLHAGIGAQTPRQCLRPRMEGGSRPDQRGIQRTVLVSARGVSRRLCGRTRAEHLHPPEPDHRLLASLRHAERRPETERNLGRTAPPADPQGAQDALAAQPALQRTVRRRPAHPRPGLPPGNRVAVAARTLREGLLRHQGERVLQRGGRDRQELRRGHQRQRTGVDLGDLRRRSAL